MRNHIASHFVFYFTSLWIFQWLFMLGFLGFSFFGHWLLGLGSLAFSFLMHLSTVALRHETAKTMSKAIRTLTSKQTLEAQAKKAFALLDTLPLPGRRKRTIRRYFSRKWGLT